MISFETTYNIENLKRKVLVFSRPGIYKNIGNHLVYRISDYIARGSATRHKWAQKLGAEPTGMLEFEPAEDVSRSKTGAKIGLDGFNGAEAEIAITGIEGIGRAFRDLEIYPVNASALTVPINKASYAKTVKDLKDEGWHIFRRGRVLVGNHGQMTGGRAVPLFVLCAHVHIPKDAELLPSSALLYGWAIDEAMTELRAVI